MRNRVLFILTALAVLFLQGCVAGPMKAHPLAVDPGPGPTRAPVVAMIDSGINPYHVSLAAQGREPWRAILDANTTVIQLSNSGSYEDRIAQDANVWAAMKSGELYAFSGTRTASMSFLHDSARRVLDPVGHGSEMSSILAREVPNATILMLQVDGTSCHDDQTGKCVIDRSLPDAMSWAAKQPWIDVITVSIALPANVPTPLAATPEGQAYVAASRLAAANGKLVVSASGNYVAPPATNFFAGPPWIIAVGGAEGSQNGSSPSAGQIVDVVANFTDRTARPGTINETFYSSGTSIATPLVAGNLARTIEILREHLGGVPVDTRLGLAIGSINGQRVLIDAKQVRDAMNETARVWGAADWNPVSPPSDDPVRNLLVQTVPVVSPWQVGWGYVDGSLPAAASQFILDHRSEIPPGKSEAASNQQRMQEAREMFWRNWI